MWNSPDLYSVGFNQFCYFAMLANILEEDSVIAARYGTVLDYDIYRNDISVNVGKTGIEDEMSSFHKLALNVGTGRELQP